MKYLTVPEAIYDIKHRDIVIPVKEISEPVIIYGAGELGTLAVNALTSVKIDILSIIDQVTYPHREINRRSVHDISEISMADREASTTLVCISKFYPDEIISFLKSIGFLDVRPFYDVSYLFRDNLFGDKYPISNGWDGDDVDKSHIENIDDVISLLKHNKSVSHYLRFLYWHLFREDMLIVHGDILADEHFIDVHNRYFIPEITSILKYNEVFVDIGAHTGSTIERFRLHTRKEYEAIHAFEPDDESFEVLLLTKYCSKDNYYKIILSSSENIVNFAHGLGYASKITNHGEICNTKTLDSFNIPTTIIKIHVEGHELNVIKGSINTITKYRPIIMVTTYHNPDGIYNIPMELSKICSNYTMLFRLHNYMGTGSIIYMIPNERIS